MLAAQLAACHRRGVRRAKAVPARIEGDSARRQVASLTSLERHFLSWRPYPVSAHPHNRTRAPLVHRPYADSRDPPTFGSERTARQHPVCPPSPWHGLCLCSRARLRACALARW